ncbi:MAG: efflux RND transporter periplasmic adaptor subunit [Firmicutes bacterium]|nr:efflux RND transporter periplasmic adaptor subunit [Bacillota bacterium]
MDIPIETKRPFWPKAIVFTVFIVLAAAGVWYLRAFARKWRTLKAEDYLLAKVEQGVMSVEVTAVGQLVPRKQTEVLAMVSGTVRAVLIKEGEKVKPGQTLAVLDSEALARELRQAEDEVAAAKDALEEQKIAAAEEEKRLNAAIEDAQDEVELRKQALERLETLYASGAASRREVEEAEAALAAAEKALTRARDEARAAAAANERQLRRLAVKLQRAEALLVETQKRQAWQEIKSPCRGTLTACAVAPGRVVNTGEKLFAVTDPAYMDVELSVDQRDIVQIKLGQSARVEVNGHHLQGFVSYIAPTVARGGGDGSEGGGAGVKVIVTIAQELPPDLLPQMKADVSIQTDRREGVLFLPRGPFLASLGAEEFVFVEGKDGRFHKRRVEFGASNADRIEIISGLREGEVVLISSYDDFLQEDEVLLGREGEWAKTP